MSFRVLPVAKLTEGTLTMNLPDWAVPDEAVESHIPKKGWITEYVKYARQVTDAPLIYHLGTAISVLSCSISHMDIEIQWSNGTVFVTDTPLWIVNVGYSAHRKSYATRLGVAILAKARSKTEFPEVLLPVDGSIEAIHDFMAGGDELPPNNNVMMFRDEMLSIFQQSRRSYSEGLKSFMLDAHSGMRRGRITKAGGPAPRTIERPRLSVLGTVQPDVLQSEASSYDWRSGWLCRFMFFPGCRTRHMPPCTDLHKVGQLVRWLVMVPLASSGMILAPTGVMDPIMEWETHNIPNLYGEDPTGITSFLMRFPKFGYVAAAVSALSRRHAPGVSSEIQVTQEDVKWAQGLMNLLLNPTKALFAKCTDNSELREETEIEKLLKRFPEGLTLDDLKEKVNQWSSRHLHRILKQLSETGRIFSTRKHTGKAGQPPLVWHITVS